ncbi:MAG: chalcone isomerase family protein [Planctomycetota bacterium]
MTPRLRAAAPLMALALTLAPARAENAPADPTNTLPAPRAQEVPTAKEGESGHRYPVTVKSTLKATDANAEGEEAPKPLTMDLLGLAIREKYFIAVNVYSYVIYMDRDSIKGNLARWKGVSAKAAGKDDALFKKLLTQGGTKELRMRFCRNVDAEDIVDAFEDSLKPRILKLRKAEAATGAKKLENLNKFRKFFSLDKLKKGNELRFTWHPDGTLSTVVNGERKPDLMAPALCKALFDVYLGSDPISKSGKKKLVKRLPDLLK